MREIQAAQIRDTVRSLILQASYVIGDDVRSKVAGAALPKSRPLPGGGAFTAAGKL